MEVRYVNNGAAQTCLVYTCSSTALAASKQSVMVVLCRVRQGYARLSGGCFIPAPSSDGAKS